MAHADWIIDLGPGAGHDGGRIVFEGTPADLVAARSSRKRPFGTCLAGQAGSSRWASTPSTREAVWPSGTPTHRYQNCKGQRLKGR